MSAYLVLFTISFSLSPHISDQVHMASLHSSGQKYLNSNFWISYMYFLWTECPCCPFTWWIEFMPRGASDNYTKASTNKAVFLFPQSWLVGVGVTPFLSDTVDLSQCIHLKASLSSQCCSAIHKYITLHFTWAPFSWYLDFKLYITTFSTNTTEVGMLVADKHSFR